MDGEFDRCVDGIIMWLSAAINASHSVLWEEDPKLIGYREGTARSRFGWPEQANAAVAVLAVRNLLRAADWAIQILPEADAYNLRAEIDQFKRMMPRLVDARNVLEHFDEYGRGVGRLQRAESSRYEFRLVHRDGAATIEIGPISIRVLDIRNAARWLTIAILSKGPLDSTEEADAERILSEVLASAEENE